MKTHNCVAMRENNSIHGMQSWNDPLGRLASWNVSLSCCEWEGVSCDRRTGHVVGVDLHNCNLSGAFRPEQLFQLRDLESLNVSSNNFAGQRIPKKTDLN
jgi:hypothetical protein